MVNPFKIKNNIGDWGLGIGDWGLGIGPNPQSPIPMFYILFFFNFYNKNNFYIKLYYILY